MKGAPKARGWQGGLSVPNVAQRRKGAPNAAWIAIVGALAAGCGANFADESTVEDLRVLVIEADPPEILMDPTQERPPPVRLRALIADPAGKGRDIAYSLVACPVPPTSGTGGSAATSPCDPATSDRVAGGTTKAGELDVDFVPTQPLAARAAAADPLSSVFGLALMVELTAHAGDETVVARKRAIYSRRLTPDQVPNQNPKLPGVLVRPVHGEGQVPLETGVPCPAPLGTSLIIEPQPAEAEAYVRTVIDRDSRRTVLETVPRETLRYAFFATAGTFSPRTTTNEQDPLRTRTGDHLESVYTPPSTMPIESADVTVWIVVRDERGGASWITRTLRLE